MTELPQRRLHRLQQYDYSQNGYYFITICTEHRRNLLSAVGNAVPGVPPVSFPTEIGAMVISAWNRMSEIDPNLHTDGFVLMPNHIHGIIVIEGCPFSEDGTERRGRRSLPEIVRAFKSVTTRQYNRMVPENLKNTLWQSSYYDEVIRNDAHLYMVRSYIDANPAQWAEDEYYTEENTEKEK